MIANVFATVGQDGGETWHMDLESAYGHAKRLYDDGGEVAIRHLVLRHHGRIEDNGNVFLIKTAGRRVAVAKGNARATVSKVANIRGAIEAIGLTLE